MGHSRYTEIHRRRMDDLESPRREPNWLGLLLTVILLAGFALAIVSSG